MILYGIIVIRLVERSIFTTSSKSKIKEGKIYMQFVWRTIYLLGSLDKFLNHSGISFILLLYKVNSDIFKQF